VSLQKGTGGPVKKKGQIHKDRYRAAHSSATEKSIESKKKAKKDRK
jgi:hypothetical protein